MQSRVPVALGSATAETEEGRAFYQERLAIFGLAVFGLSTGFWVAGALIMSIVHHETGMGGWFGPIQITHLAASAAALAVWFVTRKGQRSHALLRAVDSGGTILIGAFLGGMALFAPREAPILFVVLLAVTNTVMARAVAVPSTPSRTVWISFLAFVPGVVAAISVVARRSDTQAHVIAIFAINSLLWPAVCTVVAGIGSRVIFGLRREAGKVKQLGQYTLVEKLGEGGMGVVYRARHALLRRPTAIKLLPPHKAGKANLERFAREVQLTAELSHPNTVAIYDFGHTPDGVFYYVMELLEGLTLQGFVDQFGPMPAGRAIHVLRQVAGALTEAHERRLIHRDIKPANIMLCERGGHPDVAKVVDFGLVKDLAPGAKDLNVTAADVMTGTPLYLSPEAIRAGDEVGPWSDLYALGAVAYFLVTGKPVFEGPSIVEVCANHLHTAPIKPSDRLGKPVPPDLEKLILACLAKKKEDRPNARDLERQLAACTDSITWSTEKAACWWDAYRSKVPNPCGSGAPCTDKSVIIDLAERAAG